MITIHIIVHDAARAAEWYAAVFGAEERGRITLPDGRLIELELWFGTSRMMLADEFPEHGALSPKTTGSASAVFSDRVSVSATMTGWRGPREASHWRRSSGVRNSVSSVATRSSIPWL